MATGIVAELWWSYRPLEIKKVQGIVRLNYLKIILVVLTFPKWLAESGWSGRL